MKPEEVAAKASRLMLAAMTFSSPRRVAAALSVVGALALAAHATAADRKSQPTVSNRVPVVVRADGFRWGDAAIGAAAGAGAAIAVVGGVILARNR